MKEQKVYGYHAALNLIKARPESMIRLFLKKEHMSSLKNVLKELARAKKVYRIVDDDELEKITQSTHHEGICVVATEKQRVSLRDWLLKSQNDGAVLLDGVENPHNLGAITRSAAHFGIKTILTTQKDALSSATYRTAQGALEYIDCIHVPSIETLIEALTEREYDIIGTDVTANGKNQNAFKYDFKKKTLLILGAESTGLSESSKKMIQTTLTIPKNKDIDSLNVSCAASVLFALYANHVGLV